MALPLQAPRRLRARPVLVLVTVAALLLSGSAGYTVRSGDTLWTIASRLGVSVSGLAAANGLSAPHVIHPGQRLRVPGSAAGATAGGGSTHVVKPGETLLDISIASGVLMRDIAAANNLGDLNLVYAGQRLTLPGGAAAATAAAPAASSAAAPAAPAVANSDVGGLLDREARRYGFSPAFVKAVAYMESGWNQSARSSVGAVGVMQVMPDTGDYVERYLVGRPLDITQTSDNITAGVAFLAQLWRMTGGDVDRTLAGYYQGPRSVQDNGMYPSTRSYIANIKALQERFR